MRIGFVGLGRMGARMADRLLDAGHELVVLDTDADQVARFVERGATAASSARELADMVETILCSLPTPSVVRAVVTGAGGLVEGKAVRTIVDLSTTGAVETKALADTLRAKGIVLIDAPVSGGTIGAESGKLAIMASGEIARFEPLRPVLDALASNVFYLGDEPGRGQTMKLVNNMLAATNMVAACEALTFGASAGLKLDTMLDVINASSGRSFSTEIKIPQCILTGEFPLRFSTELLHKDVVLGLAEAEQAGAALWVIPMVRQFLSFAIGQGDGPKDYAHIIRHFEGWAGVTVAPRTEEGKQT